MAPKHRVAIFAVAALLATVSAHVTTPATADPIRTIPGDPDRSLLLVDKISDELASVDALAPVSFDGESTAVRNTTTDVSPYAESPDGQPLTDISIVTAPGHGRIDSCLAGICRYVPEQDFTGADSFRFTASLNGQVSNVATFTVTVLAPCSPGACIDNGIVLLGVNPEGNLNIVDATGSPAGPGDAGLTFLPTATEGTSNGCLCEGWGVADLRSGAVGFVNQRFSGDTQGLQVTEFVASNTSARSVVAVDDSIQVTHNFRPSPFSPNLYQVDVTIKNISAAPLGDVVYRRVMDWDIDPTPFSEYVTVNTGSAQKLTFASNDGFASANPLAGRSDLGRTGSFEDAGPDDHGALFDFGFGQLEPGAEVSFRMFYGATASGPEAMAALSAVGAEAYSLGKPGTDDGKRTGRPNTFIFAFAGVGGTVLDPPIANPDVLDTTIDNPISLNVLANDADPNGDLLTLTSSTSPAHGDVQCSPAGACTYTPASGFSGQDGFSYTVSDGHGGTATGSVGVTVRSVVTNGPPSVSAGGDQTGTAGASVALAGTANDPDGDQLALSWTVTGLDQPGNAAACRFGDDSAAMTTLSCPEAGRYQVRLTADDGHGHVVSSLALVTLTRPQASTCDGSAPVEAELSLPGGFLGDVPDHRYSDVWTVDTTCPYQVVTLISGDSAHRRGYQTYQTGEQWILEGLDAQGDVVFTSRPSEDLAEDEQIGTTDLGLVDLTGVVRLRARHAGLGGSVDSLHKVAVKLVPSPSAPQGCTATTDTTVQFALPDFLGDVADHRYSVPATVDLTCRRYVVMLNSSDEGHRPGYQPSQTGEQWILEGLDADGQVLYSSAPTPDLPEDLTEASWVVGAADFGGVARLRARHASAGSTTDSLHAVRATLHPLP